MNEMVPGNLSNRIAVDQDICGGRPRIKGTRVRVSDVLEMIAGGADRSLILCDFPYLSDEDISAALNFAARAVDHRIMLPPADDAISDR